MMKSRDEIRKILHAVDEPPADETVEKPLPEVEDPAVQLPPELARLVLRMPEGWRNTAVVVLKHADAERSRRADFNPLRMPQQLIAQLTDISQVSRWLIDRIVHPDRDSSP